MKSTVGLTIFTVALLLTLSTGLFSGGCHKFEMVYGYTKEVKKFGLLTVISGALKSFR